MRRTHSERKHRVKSRYESVKNKVDKDVEIESKYYLKCYVLQVDKECKTKLLLKYVCNYYYIYRSIIRYLDLLYTLFYVKV